MPLFDWRCPTCGFVLEDCLAWEKEDEYMFCPQCGEEMIKKIPNLTFKVKGGTEIFYPNKNKKEKK